MIFKVLLFACLAFSQDYAPMPRINVYHVDTPASPVPTPDAEGVGEVAFPGGKKPQSPLEVSKTLPPNGAAGITQPQGVRPSAKVGDFSDDQAVLDATGANDQFKKAFQQMNNTNPLSPDFGKDPNAPLPPGMEGLAKLQALMQNPMVQKYMKLFSNQKFIDASVALAKHPQKKNLMWAEITLFIIFVFLKSWRQAKIANTAQRILEGFMYTLMYMGVGSFGLPLFFFGPQYMDVLRGYLSIFTS